MFQDIIRKIGQVDLFHYHQDQFHQVIKLLHLSSFLGIARWLLRYLYLESMNEFKQFADLQVQQFLLNDFINLLQPMNLFL
jgi:hypothetical protein